LRSIYWFDKEDVEKAVKSSKRNECLLIVPSIHPGTQTPMLRPKWQRSLHGKVPVMVAENYQLSYIDEHAAQEPYWHRLQVVSYRSDSPMIVVSQDVDERLRDTAEIAVDIIPAGRVFIPPRFCHLVHVTGQTEVLRIRVEPGSLDKDDYLCDYCPNEHSCCDEMRELMAQAIAEHV